MEHDNSYKLLFSHADLVADLLRGFVHEPWGTEIPAVHTLAEVKAYVSRRFH